MEDGAGVVAEGSRKAVGGLETVAFSRKPGKNLPGLIRDLSASSFTQALLEFFANCYDADATVCEFRYDSGDNILQIKDNGTGMNRTDLEAFYRLGDSPKQTENVSPRGRHRIGKYGVATILLSHLAKSYTLETVKDGVLHIGEESFDDGELSLDKEIQLKAVPAPGQPHGTMLTLKGLRFGTGTDRFSVKDLKKSIQWQMPICDDFKVVVNGQEVQQRQIETAEEYSFRWSGKDMGTATGTFYVTKQLCKDAGVHIYINGRRVGDPEKLSRTAKIRARLVGLVKADGLEHAIIFDRGRLKEDDPGVLQLEEGVRGFIGRLEGIYRDQLQQRRISKFGQSTEQIRKEVAGLLNIRLPKTMRGNLQVTLGSAPLPVGEAARYDLESAVLTVNPHYPLLKQKRDSFSPDQYRTAIKCMAIDGIAMALVGGNATMNQLREQKSDLMRRIFPEETTKPEEAGTQSSIVDIKVYTAPEVAEITKIPIGMVRRMMECGVMAAENEKSTGKDILDAARKLGGYTPVYQIAHETSLKPEFIPSQYDTLRRQLTAHGLPFVVEAGNNGASFLLVRNEFVADVRAAIADHSLHLIGKKGTTMQDALTRYHPIPKLSERLGLPIGDVAEVIDYMKKERVHLRERNEGEAAEFCYLDVATAARKMGKLPEKI